MFIDNLDLVPWRPIYGTTILNNYQYNTNILDEVQHYYLNVNIESQLGPQLNVEY